MNTSYQGYWTNSYVDEVLATFPNEEMYTVAAGISPSGVIHFGNFRDVITAFAVQKELEARGKKTRFVFSWDDYDRFRKVPKGIDASFEEHLGKPLSQVPDPQGEFTSYAERFEKEFEASMADLGIEMEYIRQTEMYQAGKYDDQIFFALKHRKEIAKILLSFMSEKGKAGKGIVDEEYIEHYYPISVYSRFTGKDFTEILDYDGGTKITYRCKVTKKEETVDLAVDRIAKLAWKVDWPMRWGFEGVNFEPAGLDHASPGSSYDVSGQITREVFKRPKPVYAAYQFVGIQGLGSKMSGSKGNSISPGQLHEFYEGALLKFLYLKKLPGQTFSLAFDSEIYRQYEELDRKMTELKEGTLNASEAWALTVSQEGEATNYDKPIPFRQAVAFGQIAQWDVEKLQAMFATMGEDFQYDEASIKTRLPKARVWLQRYNAEEEIIIRDSVHAEYVADMSDDQKNNIRALREYLSGEVASIEDINAQVYAIPKDESLDLKENKPRQRAFFKDVYQLLITRDTGPRLSTFLWMLDREQVIKLLDI